MQLEENKIAEEMQKMEYEPLLPVEKKLVAWSLAIGVISLVVLYWVSAVFFPAAHGAA
ncbi:hypothetical protein [Nitratidesulfovibrio termitidis]|uniref:hypothetical protein n=1 Tax=Nitratidesulfovibrio termitidis TaxID=42252 RepID=UPI0003FDC68D|nr:hypothetical protein [Nitratidesulfovibrio termitidis]